MEVFTHSAFRHQHKMVEGECRALCSKQEVISHSGKKINSPTHLEQLVRSPSKHNPPTKPTTLTRLYTCAAVSLRGEDMLMLNVWHSANTHTSTICSM